MFAGLSFLYRPMNSLSGSHSRYSAGTSDIRYVKGIGPGEPNIPSTWNPFPQRPFYLFPRRYEDRSGFIRWHLPPGRQHAMARSWKSNLNRFAECRFWGCFWVIVRNPPCDFNQPYLRRTFETGRWVVSTENLKIMRDVFSC